MPYEAIYGSTQASYPTNTSAIISNLPAGSNIVYVSDANDCQNNTPVDLIDPTELVIDYISITDNECYADAQGTALIEVSGGSAPYYYTLVDNSGAIIDTTSAATGLSAGIYVYKILDNNNCTEDSIISIESPLPIEIVQQPSCYGTILVEVLNTSGDYEIVWPDLLNEDSVYVADLVAGQYIVSVFDEFCSAFDSFTVDNVFDYSITDASCFNEQDGIINIDNINSGRAPYSIYLDGELKDANVINTMEITNLLTGEYMLTVIDYDDCEITESLLVDFDGTDDCIEIPAIISPNGDGVNDSWHPIYDIDAEIEVTILNRWGQAEYYYQGNSLIFEWNGVGTGGNYLSSTDYYYIIKYQNNSYSDRRGVITLIR